MSTTRNNLTTTQDYLLGIVNENVTIHLEDGSTSIRISGQLKKGELYLGFFVDSGAGYIRFLENRVGLIIHDVEPEPEIHIYLSSQDQIECEVFFGDMLMRVCRTEG